MKKLIAVALTALPAFAFAAAADVADPAAGTNQQVCDGGTVSATNGKSNIYGGGGAVVAEADAVYVRNGFVAQCSSNVFLYFQEDSATLVAVGSGSAKGNQSYSGTSNGGAITAAAKCTGTNDACQASDATDALDAAVLAASGS